MGIMGPKDNSPPVAGCMMQAEQAKQEVAKAEEKKKVVVSKVGFNREEKSSCQESRPKTLEIKKCSTHI